MPKRRSGPGRILLPLAGSTLSLRALNATLRLCEVDDATLVAAYIAVVPRRLPLGVPLPQQGQRAMDLLEAIDQRAAKRKVPVDGRVVSARDLRDGLRQLCERERFDRIVLPARSNGGAGFESLDIAWLMGHVECEVVALKPAATDQKRIEAKPVLLPKA